MSGEGEKQQGLEGTANLKETPQSPGGILRNPKGLMRYTITRGDSYQSITFITAPNPIGRRAKARGFHPRPGLGAACTKGNYFYAATTQDMALSQNSTAPEAIY